MLDDIITVKELENDIQIDTDFYLSDTIKKRIKEYAFTMQDKYSFLGKTKASIDIYSKAAKDLGFKVDKDYIYFNKRTLNSKADLLMQLVECFENDIISKVNEGIKINSDDLTIGYLIYIKINLYSLLRKYNTSHLESETYNFEWLRTKLISAGYKCNEISFDIFEGMIIVPVEIE